MFMVPKAFRFSVDHEPADIAPVAGTIHEGIAATPIQFDRLNAPAAIYGCVPGRYEQLLARLELSSSDAEG